jgi:hypothetical protein
MTRRDWWLGIALVVAALAANAVLTVTESMKIRSAIEVVLEPKVRPLASLNDLFVG